jgi:hypothetical protein
VIPGTVVGVTLTAEFRTPLPSDALGPCTTGVIVTAGVGVGGKTYVLASG